MRGPLQNENENESDGYQVGEMINKGFE